jgi:hypothetical protein
MNETKNIFGDGMVYPLKKQKRFSILILTLDEAGMAPDMYMVKQKQDVIYL